MGPRFFTRWQFVRAMTTDFLGEASEECLDLRPADGFATIREQAGHLAEVQGIYQLALRGEPVDWSRKPEFGPPSLDRGDILEALAKRDRELSGYLDELGDRANAVRIPWYGNDLDLTAFELVYVQHESLHHGQWAAYAALGRHPRPASWVINWGL